MTLDNIIVVVSIKKKKGAILASFNKLEKDIWDWTKGKIFGSLHIMYLELKILFLISGHFFIITKNGI